MPENFKFFMLKFFSNVPLHSLGIAIKNGTISLVYLAYDGYDYQILHIGEILIPMEGNLLNKDINSLVEDICLYCQRENIVTEYCVLALTEDEFSFYRKKLPSATVKEKNEILHWEMEARLPKSSYPASDVIDEGEGTWLFGAMKKDTRKLWQDAFQKNDMKLCCITFFDTLQKEHFAIDNKLTGVGIGNIFCFFVTHFLEKNWQEKYNFALMAATYPYLKSSMFNFLQQENYQSKWKWKKIEFIYAMICIIIFVGYFTRPLVDYFSLKDELTISMAKYQSLVVACQAKAQFDKERAYIKEREHFLVKLFQMRKNFYPLVTELGVLDAAEILLDSIEMTGKDEIKITGTAKDYSLIYDFLTECYTKEIFADKPTLEETKILEDGKLHFWIRVTL